jgi:hypothetical protein
MQSALQEWASAHAGSAPLKTPREFPSRKLVRAFSGNRSWIRKAMFYIELQSEK